MANEDHIRHCIQYEFEKGSSMKLALKNIQQTFGAKSLNEATCKQVYKKLQQSEKSNIHVDDDDEEQDSVSNGKNNGTKNVNDIGKLVHNDERPKRGGAKTNDQQAESSNKVDTDANPVDRVKRSCVTSPKSEAKSMPPAKKQARKQAAPKLHEKAAIVPTGFRFTDNQKNEYSLGKEIGTGGFGRIYEAVQVGTNRRVAVKMEPMANGPLFTEIHVYQKLLKEQQLALFMKNNAVDYVGLPSLISAGRTTYNGEDLRYLIIPKYVDSVEAALARIKTCFSLEQSLDIARCVLNAYQYLHSESYVHADVKASNLLMEKIGDFKRVVLIDFGLARKLPDVIVEKEDKKSAHNGTIEFTSCDAHRGCLPSYRGDLEILTHNILYWLTSSLPWMDETDPEVVFELKNSLIRNVEKELPALLANKKSLSVVRYLYKFVRKMQYAEHIDFTAIHKALDKAR